jgi:hypothetical protein
VTASIELDRLLPPGPAGCRPRATFAHAENRLIVELKREIAVRIEDQLLEELACTVPDDKSQRLRSNLDVQASDGPPDWPFDLSQAQGWRRVRSIDDRWCRRKVPVEIERRERHANTRLARDSYVETRWFPCGCDRLGSRPRRHDETQHQKVSHESHLGPSEVGD